MTSRTVIIVEVRNHVAPERGLIQDDNMVEAFSTNRADEPLHIGCLPWGSESGENFSDFHAFGLRPEDLAVDAVAVPEQEPRRLVPGKCLHELRCGPLGSRILGDVKINDAPAIMSHNKKHVQDPESNGGYHEEVYGHQLLDMIFKKRPPRL